VVLSVVQGVPGWTAAEIANSLKLYYGWGPVEVRRRLYDLSRQTPPLVRRGEPRKCRVAGNLQSTWWPIEATS
jgi:hypothetical protein